MRRSWRSRAVEPLKIKKTNSEKEWLSSVEVKNCILIEFKKKMKKKAFVQYIRFHFMLGLHKTSDSKYICSVAHIMSYHFIIPLKL